MAYGVEQKDQGMPNMIRKYAISTACALVLPVIAQASLADEPGIRGISLDMTYEEALLKAQELISATPAPEGVSVDSLPGSRRSITVTSVYSNRRGQSGNPSAMIELMKGEQGDLLAINYYLDFSASLSKDRFPSVEELRDRQVASRGEPSCEQSGQFIWYHDERMISERNAAACMRMREVDDFLRGRRVQRDLSDLSDVAYIFNVAFDPDWDFDDEVMKATSFEAQLVDVRRVINQ